MACKCGNHSCLLFFGETPRSRLSVPADAPYYHALPSAASSMNIVRKKTRDDTFLFMLALKSRDLAICIGIEIYAVS